MHDIINSLLEDPEFVEKVHFLTRTYKANERIISQGEAHTGVFLIKSGTVRVTVTAEFKEDPNDSTLRPGVADLGANDIFGEFGLFDDLPASADVKALTDAEILEIDIPSFKNFLDSHREIAYTIYLPIIKTLVKRLRSADKVIYKLYSWGTKAHQLDKYLK